MMKIVVSNIVSLDGFVAGPHDDVLDLPMDQAFDAYNLERITAADTALVGVASYRMFSYLKASRDGEAVVFGSPTTWQALLAQGLVDELHLMVGPLMLGGGRPLPREEVRGLRPLDVRRFDGSDDVVLVYALDGAARDGVSAAR